MATAANQLQASCVAGKQALKYTLNPNGVIFGKPKISLESGDAVITASEDGFSGTITPGAAGSTSLILISAEADATEGVDTLTQEIALTATPEVVQSAATSLGVTLEVVNL